MDQILALKMKVKKYLEKSRKLSAAFMDLQKTRKWFDVIMDLNNKPYDCVDRKGLWMTKIYGMRGHLLARIRTFYEDINASVHISEELSQSFNTGV